MALRSDGLPLNALNRRANAVADACAKLAARCYRFPRGIRRRIEVQQAAVEYGAALAGAATYAANHFENIHVGYDGVAKRVVRRDSVGARPPNAARRRRGGTAAAVTVTASTPPPPPSAPDGDGMSTGATRARSAERRTRSPPRVRPGTASAVPRYAAPRAGKCAAAAARATARAAAVDSAVARSIVQARIDCCGQTSVVDADGAMAVKVAFLVSAVVEGAALAPAAASAMDVRAQVDAARSGVAGGDSTCVMGRLQPCRLRTAGRVPTRATKARSPGRSSRDLEGAMRRLINGYVAG